MANKYSLRKQRLFLKGNQASICYLASSILQRMLSNFPNLNMKDKEKHIASNSKREQSIQMNSFQRMCLFLSNHLNTLSIRFRRNIIYMATDKVYTCCWLPLGKRRQDSSQHILLSHFQDHWPSESIPFHLYYHNAYIYQLTSTASKEICKWHIFCSSSDRIRNSKIVDN